MKCINPANQSPQTAVINEYYKDIEKEIEGLI